MVADVTTCIRDTDAPWSVRGDKTGRKEGGPELVRVFRGTEPIGCVCACAPAPCAYAHVCREKERETTYKELAHMAEEADKP